MARDREEIAVQDYACPSCGAKRGQPCELPRLLTHQSRIRLVPKPKRKRSKRGSVRAIPTAFESNRRRH